MATSVQVLVLLLLFTGIVVGDSTSGSSGDLNSEPVVVLRVQGKVVGLGTRTTAARLRYTINQGTTLPIISIQNTCGALKSGTTTEWTIGDGICNDPQQLSSAKRFAVYVRASHHWERNVNFRLWRNARDVENSGVELDSMSFSTSKDASNLTAVSATPAPAVATTKPLRSRNSYAALEPRTEMTKSCSELLDECVISKYFTYTRNFKYVGNIASYDSAHPEEQVFRHRLACRVDDAEWGEWNLRVANNLPHDAEAELEVLVVFQDDIYSEYFIGALVLIGALCFCGLCAIALMLIKMVGLQRQQARIDEVQAEQVRELRRQRRQAQQNSGTTASPASTPPPSSSPAEPATAADIPPETIPTSNAPEPENAPLVEGQVRHERLESAEPTPQPRPSARNSLDLPEVAPIEGAEEEEPTGARRKGPVVRFLRGLGTSAVNSLQGTRSRVSTWRRGPRRLNTEDEDDDHEMSGTSAGAPAAATNESDSDDDDVCRICRMSEPRSSLFSPCRCDGSSRFVHRECLAEWRRSTTNPEHRKVCAECKSPYRLVRKQHMSSTLISKGLISFATSAAKLLLTLGSLFLGGYVLKAWFFIITFDSMIDWSCFKAYHIMLGFFLVVATVSYYNVMEAYINTYSNRAQMIMVFLAVLVTVPVFGYIGHFGLYLVSHVIWNWEVCFGSGILTSYVLYSNVIEYMIMRMERHSTETEEVADRDFV